MTEQELNVFLDLEWNCAAFTPEEASVSVPLSPKQRADWFWVIKHNPRLWNHCPCQDQFTKPMWWSILFSSAELLTACPGLDQFSDEDWRRLNILPKLRGRLHTSDQFRKLIELTKHPYRHHEFDDLSL